MYRSLVKHLCGCVCSTIGRGEDGKQSGENCIYMADNSDKYREKRSVCLADLIDEVKRA
ncbi:MAG: hypothetical protein U0M33_09695 [Lachnospiraceae bacterium]|nr:hypothetical protein [Lachnospiraceae bacterium]